jgi:enamine deaminase RidA (YjgF/YER057c/UK114 family)
MITHLNPAALPRNPAFSQGVAVDGPVRTVYVGGQNGAGPDLASQAAGALANLGAVLAEAGAGLEHVVSWSILVVGDADLRPALGAFAAAWGERGPAPAITVARVAGLARPDALVEINATAAVPR